MWRAPRFASCEQSAAKLLFLLLFNDSASSRHSESLLKLMSAQPASHAAKRAIYRALLRNVPWAVGRSCHASKNMKRLIRADFEPIKDANEIDAATAEAREQDFWRKCA